MTQDKNIFIHNIFYMLAYAFQELKQNNYEEINGEDFDNIQQLFAEILIKGVSCQLKQGIYKQYVPKEESLSTIRGKLNVRNTLQNFFCRKQKMACEFDELSENNIFNQIIKTVICKLISHNNVKKKQKAELRKLIVFFDNIDQVDIYTIKWNMLIFDRNNKSYQMLMYICYFLTESILMTTEKGKFKMKTFTDEHLCRLFEKFVLEYYKSTHPEFDAKAAQIEWDIDKNVSCTNILPIMQTDIMLTINDRILIIDTKYYSHTMQERYNKVSIHSNNLYQIHTYVMNEDKGHKGRVDGMLLYAKTDEEIVPDGMMRLTSGNRIFFRTLDLNVPFDKIKKQLENFVESTNTTPSAKC